MSTPLAKANIELTNEEAAVLVNLIDAAVKSLGIRAAESGVFLVKKINAAFQPPKENNVLQPLPQVGE